MSRIIDDLLDTALEGEIAQVLIGLHWTAVVAEIVGKQRCGLASTLGAPSHRHGEEDIPQAGQLTGKSVSELARLATVDQPLVAAAGLAAINASLTPDPAFMFDMNAEEVLARQGAGKKVALIGHFPFAPRLQSRVGKLWVLEQHPQPGDFPAAAAPELLPQADVVAITGTTLINHTLDELLSYCPSKATVVLLGPSTPVSTTLFDHGIDIVCGAIVTAIEPVLRTVGEGGTFRQVRRAGVRPVTMAQSGYNWDKRLD